MGFTVGDRRVVHARVQCVKGAGGGGGGEQGRGLCVAFARDLISLELRLLFFSRELLLRVTSGTHTAQYQQQTVAAHSA